MAQTRMRIEGVLRSRAGRARLLTLAAALAVMAAVLVFRLLVMSAISMVSQERVLDCPYAGQGAHRHTADCYDRAGRLVCPLPERALHTHTQACYRQDKILICTQGTDPTHTHNDRCYDTIDVLACGMDEVREEHVHGPGCFRLAVTSTTDEPIAAQMSASGTVRFAGTLAGLDGATLMEVVVSGPADALPEGTTMSLAAVADAEVEDAVRAAVGERRFARVSAIQSVDITFRDPQGNEVEPTRARGDAALTVGGGERRPHGGAHRRHG